jgi:hypothetical protein
MVAFSQVLDELLGGWITLFLTFAPPDIHFFVHIFPFSMMRQMLWGKRGWNHALMKGVYDTKDCTYGWMIPRSLRYHGLGTSPFSLYSSLKNVIL